MSIGSLYIILLVKILLKTGRQVAKSTTLGNRAITYCCLVMGFKVLYVAPSLIQMKEFIRDRITGPIEDSEVLRVWTRSTELINNTFSRGFATGAEIKFRSAFLSADRIRGVAGIDCLIIDELQDIIKDNIPIIEQVAFTGNKKYKVFLYSGTPKSLENPIEDRWSNFSTQNEFAIPCWKHTYVDMNGKTIRGYWNIIVNEECLGKEGLVCEKCDSPITYRDSGSHWVSLAADRKDMPGVFEGYHIPQVISPFCDWNELLRMRNQYTKAKFYNEVLGISYDSGEKPITRQDLMDNCSSNVNGNDVLRLTPDFLEKFKNYIFDGRPIFAGIDWGGGSDKSFTVLNIATYFNEGGRPYYVPFFWKRFEGQESEPTIQVREIIRLLREWRVSYIGVDYGGGLMPNDVLAREFGAARILKFQYSNPKTKLKWEPNLGRFMAHRSECLTAMFTAIKRRDVFRFPCWEDFEQPFGMDFLAISAEYDERSRMTVYQKNPSLTDDSAHSLLVGFLGSFCITPRRDIINPDAETGFGKISDEFLVI